MDQIGTQEVLPWRLLMSRIMGYVSLYIWIIASIPQIIENFQLKSGEGLASLTFVIWFIGDVLNLVGAVRQGLVFTVILTSGWYIISDVIICSQIYYYRYIYKKGKESQVKNRDDDSESSMIVASAATTTTAAAERSLLMSSGEGNDNGYSGSSRINNEGEEAGLEQSKGTASSSRIRKDLIRTFMLVVVAVIIPTAWELYNTDLSIPEKQPEMQIDVIAQIFAYTSAILFISARIPQFIKNYKDKSTHGLSLGIFLLTSLGNATFSASIFFYSTEYNYLVANAPFILGSLGVLAGDFVAYYQFYIYHGNMRDLYQFQAQTDDSD